jgi:hypothetical protein
VKGLHRISCFSFVIMGPAAARTGYSAQNRHVPGGAAGATRLA